MSTCGWREKHYPPPNKDKIHNSSYSNPEHKKSLFYNFKKISIKAKLVLACCNQHNVHDRKKCVPIDHQRKYAADESVRSPKYPVSK